MSHLILAAFFPGIVTANTATIVFFITLIATYLTLSWVAAREK
jgi:hypothetical protein